MKMLSASDELAKNHYFLNKTWAKNVFKKNKAVSEKENRPMKHKNHIEFGKMIQSWNILFLKEGPVIAIVLEGPHAIEIVRKMIGHTEPKQALPGTIRGDFISIESYKVSDVEQRALRNLIHASDSVENAKREISLWFADNEIYEYAKDILRHL